MDRSRKRGAGVCVPTSEVRKITVHRRLKGCLRGGGIGFGTGFAAVAVPLGALCWGLDDGGEAGFAIIYYAAVAAVAGTVAGAVIGANGSKDVYTLNP